MYSYYYNHDPSSFDHVISPPNQHILPSSIPSHLLDQLTVSEFDSVNSSGSTSGCSSYSSPTYETTNMQRSVSSHSLNVNNTPFNSHYLNDLIDSMDASSSSVRRAFSAGDLHRMNRGQSGNNRSESPLTSESNMIIEGMNRACRYSPEEKKERIERYRTKRNQRNFTKKIKYACRKTLADSRPRIRGRFARNDEPERNPQVEWNHIVEEEEEEEDEENWISYLQPGSTTTMFS